MGTSWEAYELNHEYYISFIKCTREVNETTIFYHSIKHGSFSFLCIGDNHGTVLENVISISLHTLIQM